MKTSKRFLMAASASLALAFTLGCSSDGEGETGPSSDSGAAVSSSSGGGGSSSSRPGSSSSGEVIGFFGEYGSLTDTRDNKVYRTVVIGEQTWMADNLNYEPEQIGPTRGSKCYDDLDSNCELYGRLYEWDDAVIVCPDGWKLPAKAEWDDMIAEVGASPARKLRSDSSWGESFGTNQYGFGALPGGAIAMNANGEYTQLGVSGHWWTATENGIDASWTKTIASDNNVGEARYSGSFPVNGVNADKSNQLSVRCIKGEPTASLIKEGAPLVDARDEQTYRTVVIGEQKWMAENLNFETENSKCYNNSNASCEKYGRLYNWADAMDTAATYNDASLALPAGTRTQGVCPSGWHLPSKSEWDELLSAVGGWPGKKLKARSSDWGDDYGTDAYGFGALPGGALSSDYVQRGLSGHWWTATQNENGASWTKTIASGNNNVEEARYGGSFLVNGVSGAKTNQLSVRCVEDAE